MNCCWRTVNCRRHQTKSARRDCEHDWGIVFPAMICMGARGRLQFHRRVGVHGEIQPR